MTFLHSGSRGMRLMPNSHDDLSLLECLARKRHAFTYIRFSDGEVEILRNRKLVISGGITYFRGRQFRNNFPKLDEKVFDPCTGHALRNDLLLSAQYSDHNYFKGIPTSSNNAVLDRDYLIGLNGGITREITFADLLMNSNYLRARNTFFPNLVACSSELIVVANWRAKLFDYLSSGTLVDIPDNFFANYEHVRDDVLAQIKGASAGATILSSASSLSNVLGYKLRLIRPDLTFIDIGTALNDLMGLPFGTRAYHKLLNPIGITQKLSSLKYRFHREYKMKW